MPPEGESPLVFNPGAGKLPTPEALASYAAIDPGYPAFLKEVFATELKRNYNYQLIALIAGWTFALSLAVEAGVLARAVTRRWRSRSLGPMPPGWLRAC
jgi:uncharacterized membrane protein